MILAFVVFLSFLVFMVSLDVNRDETYEKLKDDAMAMAANPDFTSALPKERGPFYFLMATILKACGIAKSSSPSSKKASVAPNPSTPSKEPVNGAPLASQVSPAPTPTPTEADASANNGEPPVATTEEV